MDNNRCINGMAIEMLRKSNHSLPFAHKVLKLFQDVYRMPRPMLWLKFDLKIIKHILKKKKIKLKDSSIHLSFIV